MSVILCQRTCVSSFSLYIRFITTVVLASGARATPRSYIARYSVSLAGEEVVAYLLARGKAVAVSRESGEVDACSLAREGLLVSLAQADGFTSLSDLQPLAHWGGVLW